jgi:acylphosphatase
VVHRLHVVFRGRVQGVGFRWFVSREARRREIKGRVWNRADGAVEVEAEGARRTLEEFLAAIGEGPPSARVQDVTVDWTEGEPSHPEFESW